jgi:hypothetical protein
MADHHGLPLAPMHRCSSQARQTSDTPQGHHEEDQLQAHKPKIIARQPEPRPARQAPFA